MDRNSLDNENSSSPEEKTAEVISNMALAHELVMNDSFKLEELPGNS